jgi:hypothetical protein
MPRFFRPYILVPVEEDNRGGYRKKRSIYYYDLLNDGRMVKSLYRLGGNGKISFSRVTSLI